MAVELLNIDCLEYMKNVPDKAFDLAICDPPYGINVAKLAYTQFEGRRAKQKNGSSLVVKKLVYKHGDWDRETPDENYFIELDRVSKNQIIWGVNYMPFAFPGGRIVWNKLMPDGVSFSDCEIAYCSLHDRVRYFEFLWAGMFQGNSLNDPRSQKGNKQLNQKRIHPTEKPFQLYEWLLKTYAKPGQRILDTHGGSMSHAIAANKLGFDLTICEIDKDYYEAAVKRYKKEVAMPLFD